MCRDEFKKGFVRKLLSTKKRKFIKHSRECVRFLFDQGASQKTSSIDKAKKVPRYKNMNGLRKKIKRNEEVYRAAKDFLSENQTAGLISRHLKE